MLRGVDIFSVLQINRSSKKKMENIVNMYKSLVHFNRSFQTVTFQNLWLNFKYFGLYCAWRRGGFNRARVAC